MKRSLVELGGLVAAMALLIAVFAWRSPTFLTPTTFLTIANQLPEALLVAVGMTFVVLIGGIDLSVGSVLGLASAVLGVALLRGHLPLPLAALLGASTGLLVGLLTGLVTVRLKLPSFIVTLGMLEAARGATYLLTESRTQYLGGPVEKLAEGGLGGLTPPFWWVLSAVILAQGVLSRTVFGRNLYAIGGSEQTAFLSGVPVARLKITVFAIAGALAGLGGLFNAARLSSADPNAGVGMELSAIAAVVIGGTSLTGGRGSVLGTALGVLVLAILGNGLAQLGVQEPLKRLLTGGVIVLAVVLDRLRYSGRIEE
ncbi:ABC transporter permease [Armatimonas rosea]|uniref:Ribose transport system permease protein n=1 Tax=Armatimonas rosea TaxID=685828 RepID=A0A7W9SKT2_ARMRO|nr:ABC transporter permease [Armatimonas rosea]MBB6048461.1 ribose transport system permease protein [Armatimonas rosea]